MHELELTVGLFDELIRDIFLSLLVILVSKYKLAGSQFSSTTISYDHIIQYVYRISNFHHVFFELLLMKLFNIGIFYQKRKG